MKVLKIKKLEEQRLTVEKGCNSVDGCYRNATLSDIDDNEEYAVTLTGDDALVSLKVGQKVLVDLRCDSHRCAIDGEWYYEYYVMSIKPLEDNVKIEYYKDWTTQII